MFITKTLRMFAVFISAFLLGNLFTWRHDIQWDQPGLYVAIILLLAILAFSVLDRRKLAAITSLAFVLFWGTAAFAAVATIYIDTGGTSTKSINLP